MEIEQEENKDNKAINKVKHYIFIEPMKNKDNSLNLNYCKNRIEREREREKERDPEYNRREREKERFSNRFRAKAFSRLRSIQR